MELNDRTVRTSTVIIVLLLLASGFSILYLSWEDSLRGGMLEKWSYHEPNDRVGFNINTNFALGFVGPDGTMYGTETPGPVTPTTYYWSSFIAINPNGTLKWRSGTNAFPGLTLGANGEYYYVDWPERSIWENNDSLAGWYNLTALDSSGNFKWSVLMNGTVDIWATYPDGVVLVHHFKNEYNNGTQEREILADEIVAVSDDGSIYWRLDNPVQNLSYENPHVLSNGTFVLNVTNGTEHFVLGITEDGHQVFIEPTNEYPLSTSSVGNGPVHYSVWKGYVDNQTTVTTAYATNASDGKQLWSTVLGIHGKSSVFTPGTSIGNDALVDGSGVVYGNDYDSSTFALNSTNGEVLWQKPSLGSLWATYPTGGVLVSNGTVVKKITPDGSTAWQYNVGQLQGRVLLTPDGTVVYSSGEVIHALAPSTALSLNQWLIISIVLVDCVSLVTYVFLTYQGRRRQR